MKTLLSALAAATFFGMALLPARGQDAISVEYFYDNLAPYGEWLDAGDYGYVWQPYDTGDDWRPYSDGRWVYTDAGWTWDSAEPYGWAVYHYGRWASLRDVGWVWVPGTEWGPGWVSWRRSPDYVGWAPLPPEAQFSSSVGFSSWVDNYYDIGPGSYRFVEGSNFGSRHLNTVFVDQRQNVTIINQTTNITNITYRDNVVFNGGPDYDEQMRRSSEPISRYKLDRRRDFGANNERNQAGYFQSRVDGDSYSVAAPRLSEGGGGKPAKLARTVRDADVDRGWRDAGSPEEVAQVRAKMKSDIPAPAGLPNRAQNPNRPGVAGNPGKGDGKGDGKGGNGNNEPGMRNRPEPDAPRPNREGAGKGKAMENENPNRSETAPRPNRMPADAPAPENGGKGGKGNEANGDRPTPSREGKGRNEEAPRSQGEGRPSPNGQGGGEAGMRPERPAPAPAPRPAPEKERVRPEAPRPEAARPDPRPPQAEPGSDRPAAAPPRANREGQERPGN
jgi:hypothetical protein